MKITKRDRQVAADILTQFMFARTMDNVAKVWDNIYQHYDLCSDPFTGVPLTIEEYFESRLEYDKQVMIERYGHCDGLE